MSYTQLGPFVFDCECCPTRCDGVSKNNYQFQQDATFSERYEQEIINLINSKSNYKAAKTSTPAYPDIEVLDLRSKEVFYLEVKVQQRTFMQVGKILPLSGLMPSETVALNLSDLLRYFELSQKFDLKVNIVWVLLNRACLVPPPSPLYFFSKVRSVEKNL